LDVEVKIAANTGLGDSRDRCLGCSADIGSSVLHRLEGRKSQVRRSRHWVCSFGGCRTSWSAKSEHPKSSSWF